MGAYVTSFLSTGTYLDQIRAGFVHAAVISVASYVHRFCRSRRSIFKLFSIPTGSQHLSASLKTENIFCPHISLGPKGEDLMKTSHSGMSVPKSLITCTLFSCGSLYYYLLQDEVSMMLAEQNSLKAESSRLSYQAIVLGVKYHLPRSIPRLSTFLLLPPSKVLPRSSEIQVLAVEAEGMPTTVYRTHMTSLILKVISRTTKNHMNNHRCSAVVSAETRGKMQLVFLSSLMLAVPLYVPDSSIRPKMCTFCSEVRPGNRLDISGPWLGILIQGEKPEL